MILCIGLLALGGLGLAIVKGSGAAQAVLGVWVVLSIAGIVEGARAWRGNLAAAIRVGVIGAIFGVVLLWFGSITFLGGERVWGERDSALRDMVMLLGFVSLVAAAEAIIGALVARRR